MRGRYLMPLVAVAGAALLAMQPASAQDEYPPEEPILTVSSATIVAGGTIVLSGEGYEPGEEIVIGFSVAALAAPAITAEQPEAETLAMVPVASTTALGDGFSVFADAEGSFSTSITLKKVGRVTITATGQSSGLSASVVVTVLPDGVAKDGAAKDGAAKHGLPETGSASWSLVRTGGVAILLGGALLSMALMWRRRRDRAGA